MSLPRVDLNLFVVFEVIYTRKSLTQAAEVLHVTQPAVSNALARLRETLNDPLFVRTPKGMSPTPLARQLIDPVREALRGLDSCIKSIAHFDPASAEKIFCINATEQADVSLLPRLAAVVASVAPGVSLEFSFTDRREVPLELAAGHLDLSLDAPLLSHAELMSQPLIKGDYVCVMRRDHPLARRKLTLAHYLAQRHVHVSSRRRGAGHVDLALRSIGERRKISLRVQRYLALPEIIAGSDYLASVPRAMAEHWGLLIKPLPFDTPPLELHMFWHRNVDHDPASQWLRQQVVELMAAS